MAEPVSLDQAKDHLRIPADIDAEDSYIGGLIAAARKHAETYTGLSIVSAEIVETFDGFGGSINLTGWPLAADADVEVSYLDAAGASSSLTGFRLLTSKRPARLTPGLGAVWPMAYFAPESVTVTYQAGYADDTVPEDIHVAILLLVGHWYENREVLGESATTVEMPFTVTSILRPYRRAVI